MVKRAKHQRVNRKSSCLVCKREKTSAADSSEWINNKSIRSAFKPTEVCMLSGKIQSGIPESQVTKALRKICKNTLRCRSVNLWPPTVIDPSSSSSSAARSSTSSFFWSMVKDQPSTSSHYIRQICPTSSKCQDKRPKMNLKTSSVKVGAVQGKHLNEGEMWK